MHRPHWRAYVTKRLSPKTWPVGCGLIQCDTTAALLTVSLHHCITHQRWHLETINLLICCKNGCCCSVSAATLFTYKENIPEVVVIVFQNSTQEQKSPTLQENQALDMLVLMDHLKISNWHHLTTGWDVLAPGEHWSREACFDLIWWCLAQQHWLTSTMGSEQV